jgi:tetratricopeptide (TPR) repeat protein
MSEQDTVDRAMEEYRLAHMIMEGKFGPAVAEAIPHLRNCADCWGQALRSKQRADALVELGKLHQRLDDHSAAAPIYAEAQTIYFTLGERQLMAYVGVLAGLALKAQNRFDDALRVVEESLAVEKDGGDMTHVSRTLLILAGLHMDLKQFDRALERFAESQPILERFGKSAELSQAFELKAVCLHELERFGESGLQFELAIAAKRDLGNLKGSSKVITRFADLERSRGRFDQALALHKRALDVHRLRNDQAMIAQSLGNIGTILADRGEIEAAHDHFQQCAQLLQAASERPGEAQALTNLHLMQLKLGKNDAALVSLARARELCRSGGYRQLRERVLHSILEILRKQNQVEQEIEVLHELAEVRQQAGDVRGLSSVLDELAVLHHGLKQYDQVRSILQRRAELMEELNDQEGLLRALDDLTGIAVEQEAWSQAADHSERALAICRARGTPAVDLAGRAYNLGLIHGKSNDFKSALECYRQAADGWAEAHNPEQAARCQRQMGACELQLPGLSAAALSHYQSALAYYEAQNDKRGIALALVGIGNAQINLGDPTAAKLAFDRAAALKEELGDQRGTTMIRKASSVL